MLPLLGLFFVADIVVTAVTGKDIIEHVTGVDVFGFITNPISDFVADVITGGSSNDYSAIYEYMDSWGIALMEYMDEWGFAIIDHIDQWGAVLQDLLYVIIILVAIVLIFMLNTWWNARKLYKSVSKMNTEKVV